MTAIKVSFSIATALVGFALLALFIFIAQFDLNDYRGEIRTTVKDATGFDVAIGGDLSWSGFPLLRVSAADITVSNNKVVLAHADKIKVRISLWPLLSGRVESRGVEVHGMDVMLARNAKGVGNWEQKKQNKKKNKKTARKKTEDKQNSGDSGDGGKMLVGGVAVVGVAIHDSRFVWDDKKTKNNISATINSLEIDRVIPGETIALTLDGAVHQLPDKFGTNINLNTSILIDSFAPLTDIKLLGVSAVALPIIPGEDDKDLSTLEKKRKSKPRVTLNAIANINPEQTAVSVSSLAIHVGKAEMHGTGSWTPKKTSARLETNMFNLRRLIKRFTPADLGLPENLLQKTQMKTNLVFTGSALEINDLSLNIDSIQAQGWMHGMLGSKRKQPEFELSLSVDQFNPADLTDKPDKKDAAGGKNDTQDNKLRQPNTKSPVNPAAAIAVLAQNHFVATTNFNIGTLVLSPQATLNDFRAVAVSKDHVLDLISLTARGFGGEFMSSALIDASRKTPRISVKGHAKKLEIGSLLKVAGADTKLSGELFSQFKLRAAGKDTEALLAALNGVVDMTVNDVALPQNDLSRNLFSVVNFLAPRLLGTHRESGESKKHDIGSNAKLKGRFQIENGVARNKNLRATNDIIDVKGRGSLNFPEQKINYSLQIGLLDAKDKRRIPMKIRGALDDPSFHVDFNSLVRQETERLIDSELGKVKESVGEKLGKEAQRLKEKLPKKALEFLKDKLKL